MRNGFAAWLILGLLTAAARAQFTSFDDFVWTFDGSDGASGSVTTDLMHVKGPDDGSCPFETTAAFTSTAPWAGTVRVHVDFVIFDLCHFDWPVYVINGVPTKVYTEGSSYGCWFAGQAEVEFYVSAGDTFGLGVGSADCYEGPGIADWTEFDFEPKDWIDVGGALDPRFEFEVSPAGANWDYGETLAGPGDVDGDGEPDIAVRSSASPKATVSMLSGKDGALLWTLAGSYSFGAALAAAGDVNGDGVPDLAASADGDNTVWMLSGSDGSTIWSATGAPGFGRNLAPFGDITGDGITDIAVAAYPAPDTPLFVLSGADGSQFASYPPPPGVGGYAWSLGPAGDVNGDGTGDLLAALGVPYGQLWKTAVVSGIDGAVLGVLEPPFISIGVWSGGEPLSVAGDVDGDGTPDSAVGASWEFAPFGWYNPGSVTIFSGATGVPLTVIYGTHDDGNLGYALQGGLDVDEDGTPEIAVGSPLYHAPYEYTFTGRAVIMHASDGTIVQEFIGKDVESFGQALQLLPGESDTALAIAAPQGSPNGRLAVYDDLDHAGGLPSLAVHGVPAADMPWLASIDHGLASHAVLVIVGTSQADLPFKGGVMVPSADLVLVERLDLTGALSFAGHWPPGVDPALDVWVQAWLVDPAGPQGWSATQGRHVPPP